MTTWERLTTLGAVVAVSFVLAKLIDLRMRRRQLQAGAETRYRILRRSVMATIVFVALMSGLLVIPDVRAIAGGLLASSAVVGLVVGLASQRTLGNFAAGLLIAFTQPLRLGDRIAIDGAEGVVEEIRLTHTVIRADDDTRLVIPNEQLASDTIRNATIVDRAQRAEISLQVPLSTDLERVIELLRTECAGEPELEVFVAGIGADATVTLRTLAPDPTGAERLERELRLRAHRRLLAAGIYS